MIPSVQRNYRGNRGGGALRVFLETGSSHVGRIRPDESPRSPTRHRKVRCHSRHFADAKQSWLLVCLARTDERFEASLLSRTQARRSSSTPRILYAKSVAE
jgi:hypothetical protein